MRDPDPRPDLLYLCHRIPFPPNKGDKIRSYWWLKALAQDYRVHLVAFVDDEEDWQHEKSVRPLCASLMLAPLPRKVATLRALVALPLGQALTPWFYRDGKVRRWVDRLACEHRIEHLLVYSSAMAQYADRPGLEQARRVIDFVDVDSDKWRQYAERQRGLKRWVYGREARKLGAYDAAVARRFDRSLFVSDLEAGLFADLAAVTSERVGAVPNGVDCEFFSPTAVGVDADVGLEPDRPLAVFTGAMDYWANVDAVVWFVEHVWPKVLAQVFDALFVIVGSRPGAEVQALAGGSVRVTGRVADVRPYLSQADAVVAPMRIARGIQNKVLEGMAMARPVVTTTKGLEGIGAAAGHELLVGDEADELAGAVVELFRRGADGMGARARERVKQDYSWQQSCHRLLADLENH